MTINSINLDRGETTLRLNLLRDLPTKRNSIKELIKKESITIKRSSMNQLKQLEKVCNAGERQSKTIKP